MKKEQIRALALALIKNQKGELLLHKAYDSVKKETFYRPLGGGIDFHESAKEAVVREMDEELGQRISIKSLISTFESIFVYEGKRGHEIIFLFDVNFEDSTQYQRQEFDIVESGRDAGKAVWRSIDSIKAERAQLYPAGIEKFF